MTRLKYIAVLESGGPLGVPRPVLTSSDPAVVERVVRMMAERAGLPPEPKPDDASPAPKADP